MKVVSVPPPVQAKIPKLNGETVEFVLQERSFCYFLQGCIESYAPFSKGHVNALLYAKLRSILIEGAGKPEIWFEDSDFKGVQAAVAEVEWRTPDINAAYIPFYKAVAEARTQDNARPAK